MLLSDEWISFFIFLIDDQNSAHLPSIDGCHGFPPILPEITLLNGVVLLQVTEGGIAVKWKSTVAVRVGNLAADLLHTRTHTQSYLL